MGQLELTMFNDLIKTQTATIRGREFTFYEIGSNDWIDHVVQDVPEGEQTTKQLIKGNRDFGVRCIACALAPGVDTPIPELITEISNLPDALIDELFAEMDSVNQIVDKVKKEGKGSPVDDSPADSH